MKRLTLGVVVLVGAVVLSAGVTLAVAVWQGTDWITDGEVITADTLKDDLDYLYERTNPSTNFVYPPTCTGTNVLQWDGDDWLCTSI